MVAPDPAPATPVTSSPSPRAGIGAFIAPVDIAGKDWRRQLALRETDLVTRTATGLIPLSVAADRIGLAAMRCAGRLARLAAAGQPVDPHAAAATTEGWIALPTSNLAELRHEP